MELEAIDLMKPDEDLHQKQRRMSPQTGPTFRNQKKEIAKGREASDKKTQGKKSLQSQEVLQGSVD